MSPEDYTPLWKWISFAWIYPLIKKARYRGLITTPSAYLILQGTYTTLSDKDVFQLSPNLQSRPVFIKFSSLKCGPQPSVLIFAYIMPGCRPWFKNSGLQIRWISCSSSTLHHIIYHINILFLFPLIRVYYQRRLYPHHPQRYLQLCRPVLPKVRFFVFIQITNKNVPPLDVFSTQLTSVTPRDATKVLRISTRCLCYFALS